MDRRTVFTTIAALAALALPAACGGTAAGGDADADGAGDAADTERADGAGDPLAEAGEPPTGRCGAAPHAWLPAADMGAIVEAQLVDEWSITAAGVNLMVASLGYPQFADATFDVEAWRVRYVTQDRGARVEATAALSYPKLADPGSVPMIVWTHGTSGFTDTCAPSAGDLEDVAANVLFASHGVAVAAPDYLGLNSAGPPAGFLHPYLVPEATAVASLDSARALLALARDKGIEAAPDPSRVLVWGASEGGFASAWTDRYAPHYAPEFTLRGVVAAVPPLDLLGLAQHGLTVLGPTSGALALALTAMHAWYGGPEPLADIFTDQEPGFVASTLARDMAESCSDFPSLEAAPTLEAVYVADFLAAVAAGRWDDAEPFSCYLGNGTLRESAVARAADVPMLAVFSELDDLVVTPPNRDDVPQLCAQGYRIDYLECAGAGHTDGAVQSLIYQWDWLQARLAGAPPEEPCVVTAPVDCTKLPRIPAGG